MSTSPRLPLYPLIEKELADELALLTYLCTEGRIIRHSSSALTNPSIASYLYWLYRTRYPMLARSRQIGGSLITILKQISPIFYRNEIIY